MRRGATSAAVVAAVLPVAAVALPTAENNRGGNDNNVGTAASVYNGSSRDSSDGQPPPPPPKRRCPLPRTPLTGCGVVLLRAARCGSQVQYRFVPGIPQRNRVELSGSHERGPALLVHESLHRGDQHTQEMGG